MRGVAQRWVSKKRIKTIRTFRIKTFRTFRTFRTFVRNHLNGPKVSRSQGPQNSTSLSALFVVRVVQQWCRHEKSPDGLYLAYCPFGALIERSQMRPYHNKLEEEAGVNIESTISVLILYHRVLAELAHWQAILECHDEVLVHDEAQATTNADVWAVGC